MLAPAPAGTTADENPISSSRRKSLSRTRSRPELGARAAAVAAAAAGVGEEEEGADKSSGEAREEDSDSGKGAAAAGAAGASSVRQACARRGATIRWCARKSGAKSPGGLTYSASNDYRSGGQAAQARKKTGTNNQAIRVAN